MKAPQSKKNQPPLFGFIVMCILYFSCLCRCSSPNIDTDRAESNLNGKVKSLTEVSYEAIERFGKIEKGKILHEDLQKVFNENGNEIESTQYSSTGDYYLKWNYSYDDFGKKVDGSRFISDDSSTIKFSFVYDNRGNQIEMATYNSDGSIEEKRTRVYDEFDNEIELSIYDSDGSLKDKITYKYDENGNKIELDARQGASLYRVSYIFDDDKNVIESMSWNNFSKDSASLKSTFTYDDYGNIIEDVQYDRNGSVAIKENFKYTYDKEGNWNQRVTYQGHSAKLLTERTIEYFE